MLTIKDLRVNYGGIEAVKGISFEVPEKSIVTLIGANGAGKSTTLRSITGLVKASGGSIQFDGAELLGMDTPDIVAKGITLVPEGRRVFPDMTVIENIKIGAYLRSDSLEDDINWVYDLFPRLKERSCSPPERVPASCQLLSFKRGAGSWPAPSPAANSRCWPLQGPL